MDLGQISKHSGTEGPHVWYLNAFNQKIYDQKGGRCEEKTS